MNRKLSQDKRPPIARHTSKDKKPTVEDILKKAVEEMANGQRREKSPGIIKNAVKPDDGLMTSMLRRVATLEKQAETHKKEIREKTSRIAELEGQVEFLKRLSESTEVSFCEELKVVVYLEKAENEDLKKEIQEVKIFLKDYGLHWKGNRLNSEGKLNKELLDQQLNAKKPQ